MKTTKAQLIQEIEQTPDFLLEEVLSFLRVAKIGLVQVQKQKQDVKTQITEDKMSSFDKEARPIWKIAQEISQKISDEEWQKLPRDLSKKLDHYLYGSPKNE